MKKVWSMLLGWGVHEMIWNMLIGWGMCEKGMEHASRLGCA